ncbi:hypothetical protein D3C86_1083640 [compost metagenome]
MTGKQREKVFAKGKFADHVTAQVHAANHDGLFVGGTNGAAWNRFFTDFHRVVLKAVARVVSG